MKKLIEYLQLILIVIVIILLFAGIVAYEYIKIAAYWKIAFGLLFLLAQFLSPLCI